MVICMRTGGLGKGEDTGRDTAGVEVKDMIMKEAKEKEDIEKAGDNASNAGREFFSLPSFFTSSG